MKKYLLVLGLMAMVVSGVAAQKQFSCKSGQDIVVDGASNFVSSNLQQLLEEKQDWSSVALSEYKDLLEKEKRNRLELAKLERLMAIQEYDMQRASGNDKNNLKVKIQTTKKDIQQCDKNYEKLSNDIKAFVRKTETEKNTRPAITTVNPEQVVIAEQTQSPPAEKKESKADQPKEKLESKDNISQVESSSCNIVFSGKDETTKKKRISLAPARMLTYTPEKMKNYYKLKNFMELYLAMEKHGGKHYFSVEARFASKDVMRSYGVIHKTDFLRIQFIGGKKVFLKINEVQEPFIDKQTNETVYKVKCSLNSDADITLLSSHYLDSFGIMWSTGFEDYRVYDVDFIQRQLKCLRND